MDTLFLGLRVAVSLAAVLAVIWYAHRRLTRGKSSAVALKPITIVGRQGIAQKASVVIVEADGRRLVLGVTEHSINVLSDSPAVDALVDVAQPTAVSVPVSTLIPAATSIPVVIFPAEAREPAHRASVRSERTPDAFAVTLAAAAAGASANANVDAAIADSATRSHRSTISDPAPHGLLRGSILSAETWKLSLTALRQGLRT